MEQAIPQLKEKRARAKAKLTSIANQLGKPVSLLDLQKLREQLEAAHSNFLDLHYEFAEYVADEKYSEQRIVSGLDLDEYLSLTNDTYDNAVKIYVEMYSKHFTQDAIRAIQKAGHILAQANKVDNSRCTEFYELVDSHVDVIRNLCSFSTIFSSDETDKVLAELNSCMLDLECIQVRHTVSGKSVQFRESHNTDHSGSIDPSHTSFVSQRGTTQSDGDSLVDSRARSGGASATTANILPAHESTRLSLGSLQQLGSTSRFHSSGAISSANELSIVNMYKSVGHSTDTPSSANEGNQDTTLHTISTSRFKFNKSPLPTFDGERKSWAEFRSIWRMHAAREFSCDEERAWELKQCLKGEALECVEAVMTSHPKAYNLMWQRLDNKYCNVGLNIQSVYKQLSGLPHIKDNDLRGLVKFVNKVELCYGQLGEVGHIDSITVNQIDDICDLLPVSFRWEWMEKYKSAIQHDQLHPFSLFMQLLEIKRDIAMRLAERSATTSATNKSKKASACSNSLNLGNSDNSQTDSSKSQTCYVHPDSKHSTEKCKKFSKMSVNEKYEVLKSNHACFRCLGKHARKKMQI